jgi:hypothetical protein
LVRFAAWLSDVRLHYPLSHRPILIAERRMQASQVAAREQQRTPVDPPSRGKKRFVRFRPE